MWLLILLCTSFVDLLCFCSVLCLLCLCARLLICALWSPAGKGLPSWLSFVVSNCEFVTFPLVECDQVTDVGRVRQSTAIHCQFRLVNSILGKTATCKPTEPQTTKVAFFSKHSQAHLNRKKCIRYVVDENILPNSVCLARK